MTNVTSYQLKKALEYFDYPPKLTAREMDNMRQRKMKKHDVAIMLVHWFNAFTWILMLTTGAGLIVSGFYKFAPDFYIRIVRDLFGEPGDLLQFHIWLGVIWILVFTAYTIFGYRKYLRKHKVKDISMKRGGLKEKFKAFQCIIFGNSALCLDENDIKWLKIRVLGIIGKTDAELPPQGSFNAGQKLYGLLVALMTPLIMITGLIMAFHLGPVWLVQWAIPLHFLSVGLVVSGLMVHVYMGAVFPEEKPAFFSMVTGNVSELFLYRHHFNFWKERIIKQFEWRKSVEPEVKLDELLPDSLAEKVSEKLEELKDIKEPEPYKDLKPTKFWSPYFAGTMLGLLFLFTYFVYGRGLGASSFLSRTGTFLWNLIAPEYTQSNPYWSHYFHDGHTPLGNFMIFQVIGLIIGAYWSARKARRAKFEIFKGPGITNKTRIFMAFAGGILMGLGARVARGCTSGQGLTGGITLAVGAWLFVFVAIGIGFFSAYLFRRYWL